MSEIYILVDTSGSMKGSVAGYPGKSKLDLVKDSLAKVLRTSHFDKIHLYTFDTQLDEMGTFKTGEEALSEDFFSMGGSTIIWDNIWKVLEKPDHNSQSTVLCITDGVDGGSSLTLEKNADFAESKGINLKIVDIEGKLETNGTGSGTSTSKIVKKISNIETLEEVLDKCVADGKQKEILHFSPVVIPLVQTEASDLGAVIKGVKTAVPYLETMTGLRYYPVPTFIVDEQTRKELIPEQPAVDIKDMPDEHFRHIARIIGLVNRIMNEVVEQDSLKSFKESLLLHFKGKQFSNNFLFLVIERLASSLAIREDNDHPDTRKCLIDIFNLKDQFKDIPDMDPVALFTTLLAATNEWFKAMDPNILRVLEPIKPEFENAYPPINTNIFGLYVSLEERSTLESCTDRKGYWDLKKHSLIEAFGICSKLILAHIDKSEPLKEPYRMISKEIHIYGTYLSQRTWDSSNELFRRFPPFFILENTGIIVISVEKIKERARENADANVDVKRLIEKLIIATTVHEHTHAISYEGVSSRKHKYFRHSDPLREEERRKKVVSECLAEWSELNYYRDDPEVYRIIKAHAQSGDINDWPYAGALILEKNYDNKVESRYRKLINAFRRDRDKAYNQLLRENF